MEHKGTIKLETARLLLRPFQKDECSLAYKNWTNDSTVTEFLRWPTHSDISVTESVINCWIEAYPLIQPKLIAEAKRRGIL